MNFSSLKKFYQKWVQFLSHDIWHVDGTAYGRKKSLALRYLKIILITFRSFSMNRAGIQAAALTFFTLIAIIPFVAVVFAITQGFGYAKEFNDLIYYNFAEQEDVVHWVLQFAQNLLDTGKEGFFGIVGFLIFFISIIWVMASVEQSFNRVWQVKNNHSFARKTLIYLSLIIISPLIFAGAFAIPLSYHRVIAGLGLDFAWMSSVVSFFGRMILFFFVGVFFFLAFKFIPNTKVRIMPAINAAIIITLAFTVVQIVYVETQLFVSRLNAIYGAFAAVPLFMIWININWFILLLGAEMSFAFQNLGSYEFEQAAKRSSPMQRRLAALLIMQLISKRFKNNESALDMDEITTALKIPSRLVHRMVQNLLSCGLLVEIHPSHHQADNSYIPGVALDKLSILYILSCIDNLGSGQIVDTQRPDMSAILAALSAMDQSIANTDMNKLIHDI